MAVDTVKADGLYSVAYNTTRLGNVATGFNLTMTGAPGTMNNKKTVNASFGSYRGEFGSKDGIVLSTAKRFSRTYKGETVVVVDPIFELFQKLIVVEHSENSFTAAARVSGVGNLVVLQKDELSQSFYKDLGNGDVKSFVNRIIEPGNIDIKYDKADKSPIINALRGLGAEGNPSMDVAREFSMLGKMFTVGDIFTQFLAPLGLELYWVKDKTYSLEPPRLSQANPKPNEIVIKKEDIIDMHIRSDPFNAPDIIIPTFTLPDTLGSLGGNLMATKALTSGIIGKQGGKNLKVSTYDVPSFILNPFKMAFESAAGAQGFYEGGMPSGAGETAKKTLAKIFGSHARKSSLYKLSNGDCVLTFRPDITEPYSWYTIDDELCFVSDIRHDINRSSAVTVLTIAGIYEPDNVTEEDVGEAESDLPEIELRQRSKLQDAASAKTVKIKQDVKEGSKEKIKEPFRTTREEMALVFGDPEKSEEEIDSCIVAQAVTFVK